MLIRSLKNKMSQATTLVSSFVSEAKRLFETYRGIEHTWQIGTDEDQCTLLVPKTSNQGFDVYYEVSAEEIVVYCEAFHEHYPLEDNLEEFTGNCIGMLYDLLSTTMRLVEYRAGKNPYKWTLEMMQDGAWEAGGTTGLIFYNYLSKRSKRILQNTHLEPRTY